MSEFINEFGKENFIIIIVVVGVILLALVTIIIIEKFQIRAKMKKQIKKQISNISTATRMPRPIINNEVRNSNYIKEPVSNKQIIKEEPVEVLENQNNYEVNNNINTIPINNNQNSQINENYIPQHSKPVKEEIVIPKQKPQPKPKQEQEVVYVENTDPTKDAKEKLEEVTKKLIDKEDDLIDHTHFETEQEEKSIISYDELIKASHDIDSKNDKLLEDEGEAAITIDELYKKHIEEQNIIEEEEKPAKVNNPVFEDEEPKKFKNSEVISPVFGFYSGKTKQETEKDVLKRIDKNLETQELEDEIQKTEDFLSELKKLKNKLD